jgi:hypothetical protein
MTKAAQIIIDSFKLNDYISSARICFFYKSVPRTFLIVYDSKNNNRIITKALIKKYGNFGMYRDGEDTLLDFTPPMDITRFGGNVKGMFIVLDLSSSLRLKGRSPYSLLDEAVNIPNYSGLKVYKLDEKEDVLFTPEYAESILEGSEKIPDGWYVHGRRNDKKFGNDDWPTQFTQDIEIANSYGRKGSVWIARPTNKATVLDFSKYRTKDLDKFVLHLKEFFDAFKNGERYPDELDPIIEGISNHYSVNAEDLEWKDFEEEIRNTFTPHRIVDTAEAYDSSEWINLLQFYNGLHGDWPDFIETPDGAVLMPGSASTIEAYNLTEIASQLNEAYTKQGDWYDKAKSIDFDKYKKMAKQKYERYGLTINKAKTTESTYGIMTKKAYTELTGIEFPEKWPRWFKDIADDYYLKVLRLADHNGSNAIVNFRPDASESDIEDADNAFGNGPDDGMYFANTWEETEDLLDLFFAGKLKLPE